LISTASGMICLIQMKNGAPEEIRTPDPQIRRLLRAIVSKAFFCKTAPFDSIADQYVSGQLQNSQALNFAPVRTYVGCGQSDARGSDLKP
jgi:hypothetical protein